MFPGEYNYVSRYEYILKKNLIQDESDGKCLIFRFFETE